MQNINKENATGRPIVETRMTYGYPCWKGSYGATTRSDVNERLKKRRTSGCTQNDIRYTLWDTLSDQTVYTANNVPTGGGQTLGDSSVTATQFYYDTNTNWSLSYRQELYWKEGCESGTIADLESKTDPFGEITGYQFTLVILNGIFGLGILGLIIPWLQLLHLGDSDSDLPCVPGSGEEEKVFLQKCQKISGFTGRVAKLIPLFLCLGVVGSVIGFFKNSSQKDCGDLITNGVMDAIATALQTVQNNNFKTLGNNINFIHFFSIFFLNFKKNNMCFWLSFRVIPQT